ncbi:MULTISPECIES: NAD(P)-dependent alcohol dehydrogenase [unclassified Nocardioides]|uniref:NAD(P)-dependent alcohol dehydrogenase n=1 Tax=unclassified Nocardioides TaxID=2615069 RepID=UPI0006F400B9|nr:MULTISPECIES: NAD(P)-dependent alcohol dehydrogenase [unclassified Nocardioides]KQY50862.1 geraniol dehydrogenase [Nocardioides sp. Root140]KRF14716.1 geraniol dehydrogenase [Nocardioides sp. Soil796]
MQITAAVLEGLGQDFVLQELTLADPAPDEVVIEIAGVGLCHTDLAVQHGHLPFPFPGVVGHEGSGTVVAVGSDVTKVVVGDPVAATFNSCGMCTQCAQGAPSYCADFMGRNFGGARPDGTSTLHRQDTACGSYFFGQSSFATHSIARERNVVKVNPALDIALAGPLGCGIQTGAGAVMQSMACPGGSSLLVVGGGSVGLSGVLGAVVRELGTIIVAEPLAARRQLALELGATHVIDPAAGPLSEQVRAILPEGVGFALDTTAAIPVVNEIIASLAQRGTLGMVGVPSDPTSELAVGLIEMQARGLHFQGIVEGDSDPDHFIPELVDLHLAGRFPFDRLVTTMPFAKINDAVAAQARGEAVKVVLVHE